MKVYFSQELSIPPHQAKCVEKRWLRIWIKRWTSRDWILKIERYEILLLGSFSKVGGESLLIYPLKDSNGLLDMIIWDLWPNKGCHDPPNGFLVIIFGVQNQKISTTRGPQILSIQMPRNDVFNNVFFIGTCIAFTLHRGFSIWVVSWRDGEKFQRVAVSLKIFWRCCVVEVLTAHVFKSANRLLISSLR